METIGLDELCITMQQDLMDIAGSNYPAMQRQRVGLLDALISDANTVGFEQVETLTTDGKKRQVSVSYIQPGIYQDTENTTTNICTDDGEEVTQLYKLVELTNFRRTPILTFSKAELQKFCDAPSEYRAKVLNSRIDALMVAINRDLATLALANVGIHAGGDATATDVQMLIAADSGQISADYTGAMLLQEELEDLSIFNPFVVGSGNLSKYAKLAAIGCCNDLGQDANQFATGMQFYRDQFFGGVAGAANNFLAFAPGALQFVFNLNNRGEFRRVEPSSIESTMVDPITGLELDMEFYYDRCDKVYKLGLSLDFGLFNLPDDIFATGDDREGVNFSWLFNATQYTPA